MRSLKSAMTLFAFLKLLIDEDQVAEEIRKPMFHISENMLSAN